MCGVPAGFSSITGIDLDLLTAVGIADRVASGGDARCLLSKLDHAGEG